MIEIRDGVVYVDDKAYPWALARTEEKDYGLAELGIDITRQARFVMENGWSLSVIWGSMAYSSNHHCYEPERFMERPDTVEIALIDEKLDVIIEPYPYVDARVIRQALDILQTWPTSQPTDEIHQLFEWGQIQAGQDRAFTLGRFLDAVNEVPELDNQYWNPESPAHPTNARGIPWR